MYYIYQFIIVFFATIGFNLHFNCPRRAIIITSILSALVWCLFKFIIINYGNYPFASFISALVLGLSGEFLARLIKKPATISIIPGLIPMVPGAGIYYAMYYFIYGDYGESANHAINTLWISIYLALGIFSSFAITKVFTTLKSNKKNKL
ncbi:threonine/serine exporter family protein [Peptoniphilus catoniae]|uniref:threonine/serine exporter family protein n=1 Tax=Peptoniphilus catoniae TaxID=1660341 RepID=UPI0010FD67A3|nr:threonine/serine exporter family protein [Peptoniphilus catoniae]